MPPQLAVVCSTHNGSRWISPDALYPFTAIESVLEQVGFSDFEFLVVDDGSTDATWAKLIRYRDPRMHIYRHSRRLGLSASLREAVERTQAPLIARIDIDDACLPHRFKVQTDFLAQHPEIGLLGSAAVIDGPGWCSRYQKATALSDSAIRWRLLWKNPFVHSSIMMRRSVYQLAGGYDPEFVLAQDYDLWTRMAPHTKMFILGDHLVRIRQHDGQLTVQKRRAVADWSVRVVSDAVGRCQYPMGAELLALLAWVKARI